MAEAVEGYRPDIDGLRALAILPVMFFHAGVGTFSGGFVGVDVFFVISGYLITAIILEDQKRGAPLIKFYERRVRRIVPALVVVVISCCIAAWIIVPPNQLQHSRSRFFLCRCSVQIFYFGSKAGISSPRHKQCRCCIRGHLPLRGNFMSSFRLRYS